MRFLLSSSDMYDNEICGADCGEDSQNRLIFRVFRLISAVFWVFRVPLTPSFVADAREQSAALPRVPACGKRQIAPEANDRYSVPYESGAGHRYHISYKIEQIKYNIWFLFFLRLFSSVGLWGRSWGNCGVKRRSFIGYDRSFALPARDTLASSRYSLCLPRKTPRLCQTNAPPKHDRFQIAPGIFIVLFCILRLRQYFLLGRLRPPCSE